MSYVFANKVENGIMQPIERRAATFFAVLAMHIGLIILLVLARPAEHQPKKQGSFSVFSLAAAAQTAPPVPIAVPFIPAETRPVNPLPSEIFAEQRGAQGDPDGEACAPVDAVTAQLANDPSVLAAIMLVPREQRSVSEAIVMWNAEWSSSAITNEAPLAGIRDLILLALADMPRDCLAMPVIGPRLIPIAEGDSTTFLAFGSGEWSWQQLVETETLSVTSDNEWTWEQIVSRDFFHR